MVYAYIWSERSECYPVQSWIRISWKKILINESDTRGKGDRRVTSEWTHYMKCACIYWPMKCMGLLSSHAYARSESCFLRFHPRFWRTTHGSGFTRDCFLILLTRVEQVCTHFWRHSATKNWHSPWWYIENFFWNLMEAQSGLYGRNSRNYTKSLLIIFYESSFFLRKPEEGVPFPTSRSLVSLGSPVI